MQTRVAVLLVAVLLTGVKIEVTSQDQSLSRFALNLLHGENDMI